MHPIGASKLSQEIRPSRTLETLFPDKTKWLLDPSGSERTREDAEGLCQGPVFWNGVLMPQVLGLLAVDGSELHVSPGIVFGYREPLQLRLSSLPGTASGQWWADVRMQNSPNISQGPSQLQSFHGNGWGFCCSCIIAQLLPPPLLPSPGPYRCISQDTSPINLLHATLSQDLSPGNQT